MKNSAIYILILLAAINWGCAEKHDANNQDIATDGAGEELSGISNCDCQQINLIVSKRSFTLSDTTKIRVLTSEFRDLKPIKDDGRVIFGDTIVFNCQDNNMIVALVNEDYIKLNGVKYKPQKSTTKLLRKYDAEATVSDVIKRAIANMESTTRISLRNCYLKSIPKEIFALQNLEHLDLSINLIEEIPSEIHKLVNLKTLGISYNLIHKISPNIAKLENIESIWFLDNQILVLPDEICQLSTLNELNLNGNPIGKLPDCIPEMRSLRKITVGKWDEKDQSETIIRQAEEFQSRNQKLVVGL